MFSPFLLPVPFKMGKGKHYLIQRKGTCPICRQDIRRIHYKKQILEPDYLRVFDEMKEYDEEEELSRHQPRPSNI